MSKLTDKIKEELAAVDCEEQFCQMLDESGHVKVGGYEYSPSEVLKAVDRAAFRSSLNDYSDSLDLKWIGGNGYYPKDVDRVCTEFVEKLTNDVSNLESSLEERSEAVENAQAVHDETQREIEELTEKLRLVREEITKL
jgi:hypothetical protein